VKKLRGVYFNWANSDAAADIDNGDDNNQTRTVEKNKRLARRLDDRRHLGMLAQDVLEIFPEAVSTLPDGKYFGVNYHDLIPLLVESIRELDVLTADIVRKLVARQSR
jgi:hypothetical protein